VRARILNRDIARVVCAFWPVSMAELQGPERTKRIAQARHAAMWLGYRYTNRSTTVLGRYYRRDHATVLHGIRAVESGHWDRVPGFRERLRSAEGCVALLRPVHGPDCTISWPAPVPVAASFPNLQALRWAPPA